MLEVKYELVRRISGPIDEVLASSADTSNMPPAIQLSEVIDMLGKLAFIVETLAHLQRQEHLLETTDKAREMMKALLRITLV